MTVQHCNRNPVTVAPDGNATADRIMAHSLVVNGDTSRTETTSATANNGALLAKTITATSADGPEQTITNDLDCDGILKDLAVKKFERSRSRHGGRAYAFTAHIARLSIGRCRKIKSAGAY